MAQTKEQLRKLRQKYHLGEFKKQKKEFYPISYKERQRAKRKFRTQLNFNQGVNMAKRRRSARRSSTRAYEYSFTKPPLFPENKPTPPRHCQ